MGQHSLTKAAQHAPLASNNHKSLSESSELVEEISLAGLYLVANHCLLKYETLC